MARGINRILWTGLAIATLAALAIAPADSLARGHTGAVGHTYPSKAGGGCSKAGTADHEHDSAGAAGVGASDNQRSNSD